MGTVVTGARVVYYAPPHMAGTKPRLYKTETRLKRRLRVSYPAGNGNLVLRTEQDWDKDVEPSR